MRFKKKRFSKTDQPKENLLGTDFEAKANRDKGKTSSFPGTWVFRKKHETHEIVFPHTEN